VSSPPGPSSGFRSARREFWNLLQKFLKVRKKNRQLLRTRTMAKDKMGRWAEKHRRRNSVSGSNTSSLIVNL